jgi:hypothetical protein
MYDNSLAPSDVHLNYQDGSIKTIFLAVLVFELKASYLQYRHFTT